MNPAPFQAKVDLYKDRVLVAVDLATEKDPTNRGAVTFTSAQLDALIQFLQVVSHQAKVKFQ